SLSLLSLSVCSSLSLSRSLSLSLSLCLFSPSNRPPPPAFLLLPPALPASPRSVDGRVAGLRGEEKPGTERRRTQTNKKMAPLPKFLVAVLAAGCGVASAGTYTFQTSPARGLSPDRRGPGCA
ncbi:MAG: hypothetical protein BJ554DRAFT_2344, partial [Olpidium bornovanus]